MKHNEDKEQWQLLQLINKGISDSADKICGTAPWQHKLKY